jgi:hypothetical protein
MSLGIIIIRMCLFFLIAIKAIDNIDIFGVYTEQINFIAFKIANFFLQSSHFFLQLIVFHSKEQFFLALGLLKYAHQFGWVLG